MGHKYRRMGSSLIRLCSFQVLYLTVNLLGVLLEIFDRRELHFGVIPSL